MNLLILIRIFINISTDGMLASKLNNQNASHSIKLNLI